VAELTLGYRPITAAALATQLGRSMAVDPQHPASRLRVYDLATWERQGLRTADDPLRRQHAAFEAGLQGSLRFLHREASGPWQRRLRSLFAFALNRGPRELVQRLWQRDAQASGSASPGFWALLRLGWRMASHAGEVRRFDYDLTLGPVVKPWAPDARMAAAQWAPGQVLHGAKRLTYNRRANPWVQLTTLQMDRHPGLPAGQGATLLLDARFMARQGIPLAQITAQEHGVAALAELSAFVALFARLLASVHLWSFVKPDAPTPTEPERLPGPITVGTATLEPVVTELRVGECPGQRAPVIVRPRATRAWRRARACGATRRWSCSTATA
jgi:hypothetical protein